MIKFPIVNGDGCDLMGDGVLTVVGFNGVGIGGKGLNAREEVDKKSRGTGTCICFGEAVDTDTIGVGTVAVLYFWMLLL